MDQQAQSRIDPFFFVVLCLRLKKESARAHRRVKVESCHISIDDCCVGLSRPQKPPLSSSYPPPLLTFLILNNNRKNIHIYLQYLYFSFFLCLILLFCVCVCA